jgi:hypothetical protein
MTGVQLAIYNKWVLAARARPCAARTRLFGLINTPNGSLRAPPPAHRSFAPPPKIKKYSKNKMLPFWPELGPQIR